MSFNINFDCLPNEVVFGIFSLLGLKDLGRCSQVSKRFEEIASDNTFWSSIHKKFFSWLSIPKDHNIKKFIDQYLDGKKIIISEEDLITNMEKFVKKVQLNQTGIFSCSFPINSDFSFKAKIAYKEPNFKFPTLSEEYIFTKELTGSKDLVSWEINAKSPKKYTSLRSIYIDLPNASDCTIFNKTMRIIENRIDELAAIVEKPE